MNCQIRGLTSIRKGLGKDHIPFLVNSNSIIASENLSGGVLFFCQPGGYYFIKGLKYTEEKIIVRDIRLLTDRLGISDCTGNLTFKKDQTKTKQDRTRIFATISLN